MDKINFESLFYFVSNTCNNNDSRFFFKVCSYAHLCINLKYSSSSNINQEFYILVKVIHNQKLYLSMYNVRTVKWFILVYFIPVYFILGWHKSICKQGLEIIVSTFSGKNCHYSQIKIYVQYLKINLDFKILQVQL